MADKAWTYEDLSILKDFYSSVLIEDLCEILRRTKAAVILKASRIGISNVAPKRLASKTCINCDKIFEPQNQGYNAKYCSKGCRETASRQRPRKKYQRKYNREQRKHYYDRAKSDPDKHEIHKQQCKDSKSKVREWLNNYKTGNGCIDCGYNKHPAALQLDHTGEKNMSIADARSSISRLQWEIEQGQCVVRCAVCHSVKTWADKNGLEYKPEMAR